MTSLPKTKVRNAKELQLRKILIKSHLLSKEIAFKSKIPFTSIPRPAWLTNEMLGILASFVLKRLVKKVIRKS